MGHKSSSVLLLLNPAGGDTYLQPSSQVAEVQASYPNVDTTSGHVNP